MLFIPDSHRTAVPPAPLPTYIALVRRRSQPRRKQTLGLKLKFRFRFCRLIGTAERRCRLGSNPGSALLLYARAYARAQQKGDPGIGCAGRQLAAELRQRRAVDSKIDVRQIERGAQRRRLRVAVPALALLLAASSLLGLLAGSGRRAGVAQIPSWPQSSTLVQRPGTSAHASLTVRFHPGVSQVEQQRLLRRFGAVETGSIPALHLYVVSVAPAKAESFLQHLRLERSIEEAAPDDVRQIAATVSDPAFSSQWALDKIGWSSAFRTVKPKRQVTIAVLDTGVDGANRDFAGRLTGGFSVFGSKPTTGPPGHGTGMAGIPAAAANNRHGIAGVAFAGARIMPIQVLNAQGYGRDSDIVK